MRFWDSSALVPLVVQQASTPAVRKLVAEDPQIVAWLLSDVEFRSAVHRLVRDGAFRPEDASEAVDRFAPIWAAIHVVSFVDPVKTRAMRLLGVHPLRAADALQLGAALTAALDDPASLDVVTLDDRLASAARREGFRVIP